MKPASPHPQKNKNNNNNIDQSLWGIHWILIEIKVGNICLSDSAMKNL